MDSQFPISFSIQDSKPEGIIQVLFKLDPAILDGIARRFYDSHIEVENNVPKLVPNAHIYKCPICGAEYDRELTQNYSVCTGTQAKPHKRVNTIPKDWNPPLTQKGINFLLSVIETDLSSNLSTGNYGDAAPVTRVSDAKEKLQIEKMLRRVAWAMASYHLFALLGNKEFLSPNLNVKEFFSYSFCSNYIISMSMNIYSTLSKGKNMEAIEKLTSNRVVMEARNMNEMGYSSRHTPIEEGKTWLDKFFDKTHNM